MIDPDALASRLLTFPVPCAIVVLADEEVLSVELGGRHPAEGWDFLAGLPESQGQPWSALACLISGTARALDPDGAQPPNAGRVLVSYALTPSGSAAAVLGPAGFDHIRGPEVVAGAIPDFARSILEAHQ